MHPWTIILAAGQGSRLAHLSEKKQFLLWKERPLFWHCLLTMARLPVMQGIVLVLSGSEHAAWDQEIRRLKRLDAIDLDIRLTAGGSTRQESSRSGLKAVPEGCDYVLIHDAARPFVSPQTVATVIDELAKGAQAVVPAVPVTDTIKQMRSGSLKTLPRDALYAVQTPQGFCKETVLDAHRKAQESGLQGTDDASLVEILGKTVTLTPGDENNIKITKPADLERLRPTEAAWPRHMTGWGYDVHRYGTGRPMKLGGVPITNGPQIVAHSDGDVLLHAIIDAVLGCLGQGDIGDLFPDSDPRFENANSGMLLAEVLELAKKQALIIEHLDATLICQVPKLGPWKAQIRSNLSGLLELAPEQVSIKATTEEGLGFTGASEGIKAVALLTAHQVSLPRSC